MEAAFDILSTLALPTILNTEQDPQDESVCKDGSFVGKPKSNSDFWRYNAQMTTLNLVTGVANWLIFAAIIAYMVVSCMRKHRMTGFTWVSLVYLASAVLMVAVGQVLFANPVESLCSFPLHLIYGVENIMLFNLSVLIGYKT